ncbi:MAG: hypothetical protein KGJ62_03420 [Armatimonadetes bacterium]|nr:hypothetical protein [Armatimonadota bacterium]MDE2205716.1 hypothetical protein [Armatimonadota bacterium]
MKIMLLRAAGSTFLFLIAFLLFSSALVRWHLTPLHVAVGACLYFVGYVLWQIVATSTGAPR